VAGGQLDLPETLVGLDAGGELDLVAVRVEPAATARVRADDPAAPPESADVVRESSESSLDQNIPGRHVQVDPAPPESPT
jgi:hypothetical protein